MVIAYDRKDSVEDAIMFERDGKYEIQVRHNLIPIKVKTVENDGEMAYSRAEKIFEDWGFGNEVLVEFE